MLKKFGSSKIKIQKDIQDFATDADLASEKLIIQQIRQNFPASQIIAEESYAEEPPQKKGLTWIIDPLDGTKNFHRGLPSWNVSIACQQDGQTILGVIYVPLTRELFVAQKGQGSFRNQRKIQVSPQADFTQSLTLIGLPRAAARQKSNCQILLKKVLPEAGRIRIYGAAALELAYVASGAADSYLDFSQTTKIWDIAAGELLVREAGGRVVRLNSAAKNFPNASVLASNKKLFPQLKKLYAS